MQVSADYTDAVGTVGYDELLEASRDLLHRLTASLVDDHPGLTKNPYVLEVLREASA